MRDSPVSVSAAMRKLNAYIQRGIHVYMSTTVAYVIVLTVATYMSTPTLCISLLVQSDVIAVQVSIKADDTSAMTQAHPAEVDLPKADLQVRHSVIWGIFYDGQNDSLEFCLKRLPVQIQLRYIHEYYSTQTLDLSFTYDITQ